MMRAPWDWRQKVGDFLKPETRLLCCVQGDADIDFLLSLRHPFGQTAVCAQNEAALHRAEKRLAPLGVAVYGETVPEGSCTLLLCRFMPYDVGFVLHALAPGGYFLTEQRGGSDLLSLRKALGVPTGDIAYNLENERPRLQSAGLRINFSDQCYLPLRFETPEALSAYAAETGDTALLAACADGKLCKPAERQGTAHRFFIVARRTR